MPVALTIVKSLGTKAVGAAFGQLLGIDVRGRTLEQRGKQLFLAIFAMQSLHPEPNFEQRTEKKLHELDQRLTSLRRDLTKLQDQLKSFTWQVDSLFYEAREEALWQDMLNFDIEAEVQFDRLRELSRSTDSLENRTRESLVLAERILTSSIPANIGKARLRILGGDVGGVDERVRGFLEIWKQQAVREADKNWQGDRLAQIYGVLEAKFTRALLLQMKSARLMMEAHGAKHAHDSSKRSPMDYFADELYPMLVEEVQAFRDVVETLIVNTLPLPTGPLMDLVVPEEIVAVLGVLDYFTGQALGGRIEGEAGPLPGGRELVGRPAVAGGWGRVLVPGRQWIRRAAGTRESAQLRLKDAQGKEALCPGTLVVRAVNYVPVDGRHKGYELYISNQPRAMDKLLVVHFVPDGVIPSGLAGPELDARLEDRSGNPLVSTRAVLCEVPTGPGENTTMPFSTFTMLFTGGAQVRGL